MKTRLKKLIIPALALCALLGGSARSYSQALVTVDPNANWIGYMNVFALPVNGGNYIFGNPVPVTGNLRAGFTATNVLIRPCTNVWETVDTSYVQADGLTPAVVMDANFYVQDDTLVNSNVVFLGTCLSNTLTANPEPLTGVSYTSVAFIKIFDGGYGLIGSVTTNLVAGQTFSISLSTVGAVHAQYGFETMGPDANPSTADALGNVQVAVVKPSALVTVDPGKSWQGFMNVFNLPADGGGYIFGQGWGASALQAVFTSSSQLTLSPDTNVWNPTDAFWVKPDGVTPNKQMDASFYVQNDNLINSNVVFVGSCIDNSLTTSPEPLTGITYTSVAFVKAFNSGFSVIASATAPLIPGQPWALSVNTTNAVHVQYGFETIGPDANPSTAPSLGVVDVLTGVPPPPPPVPTNNAPTPTQPANKVLSLYNSSGTYTNHPIERWLASWSSSGQNIFTIAQTGRAVLKYSNLQYAGVEFYDNDPVNGAGGDNVNGAINYAVNATNYDTFHVDVWTPNANQFGVEIVSINPTEGPLVQYLPSDSTITSNHWISLDIPLSAFTSTNSSLNLSDLQQMLWIDNLGGGGVVGGTFYIDNVYFYSSSPALPTLSANIVSGSLQLSFATQNGSNYDVQYKTNLTDVAWQTLSTVPGNGSTQMVPDSTNQKSRYYRLFVH